MVSTGGSAVVTPASMLFETLIWGSPHAAAHLVDILTRRYGFPARTDLYLGLVDSHCREIGGVADAP